jgi:hypothetical protein
MENRTVLQACAALGLAAAAVPAAAQSLGPQARAEIRISVSVRPRVYVSAAPSPETETSGAGGLSIRSNAPALRYSLLAQTAVPAKAQSGGIPCTAADACSPEGAAEPGGTRLILIVPD